MATEATRQGSYYAIHSHIQEKWHALFFRHLSFPQEARVLDLGCGDGRFTRKYLTLAPQGSVVGLDSSESMIAWANSQNREVPQLTFAVQDISHLERFRNFDWVVSTNCLHWVPDHGSLLREISHVLKPGGACALLFCTAPNGKTAMECALEETIGSEDWRPYFRGLHSLSFSYPQTEYVDWALKAGFSQFKITPGITEDEFETPSSFMAWIKGWMTFLERLPDGLYDLFVEEVAHRYLQKEGSLTSGGKIRYAQHLFLIQGRMPMARASSLMASRSFEEQQ